MLRVSQNFFSGGNATATFHNLPGVVLVTTDTVSHLRVDGDVLGVTGYTDDEFVALNPAHDFLSPKADCARLASIFVTMIDPAQTFVEVDIPYIHKDGHTIWLRACHGSRVIGTAPNGKAIALVVFRDVTAQHEISSGSIETTETSHNLPGVILVTTDMTSHLSVDGDVLGVTGYTAEEFVALDPRRDFLSPKADRVKLASMGVAMMDPTQAFVEVDIPYIHKDGHTIWLRACQGSRMVGTTANGRPKVMAVFSDVTAKVQREAVTETWTEDDSELRAAETGTPLTVLSKKAAMASRSRLSVFSQLGVELMMILSWPDRYNMACTCRQCFSVLESNAVWVSELSFPAHWLAHPVQQTSEQTSGLPPGHKLLNTMLRLRPVQHLNLGFQNLNDHSFALTLAGLKHCAKTLQHLTLYCNRIGNAGAAGLATWLSLKPPLTHLDVSENRIGASGAAAIARYLPSCPGVRVLKLRGNKFGTNGVKAIAECLPALRCIEGLDVSENDMGPAGATALARGLSQCTTLRNLSLHSNNTGLDGTSAIAGTLHCLPLLKSLNVSDNDMEAPSAAPLAAALPRCPFLRQLFLHGNDLGEAMTVLSSALSRCRLLQELDLSMSNIDEYGMAKLAHVLPYFQALDTLSLQINEIGPAGALHLARVIPRCPALTALNLGGNGLDDSGATHLSTVLPHSNIETLDLSSNEIQPEGGASLASAVGLCPSLQRLTLRDNNLGPSGLDTFVQMFKADVSGRSSDFHLNLSDNDIHHSNQCPVLLLDESSAHHQCPQRGSPSQKVIIKLVESFV